MCVITLNMLILYYIFGCVLAPKNAHTNISFYFVNISFYFVSVYFVNVISDSL